jgi:predicted transcriptional regulator
MLTQIITNTTSIQKQETRLKYRCKADIFAVILETAASGEVSKSKIYYKSFLTYQRLKGYMSLLIEAGLMQYFDYKDKRLYRTTEKGIIFLEAYNNMRELIDKI